MEICKLELEVVETCKQGGDGVVEEIYTQGGGVVMDRHALEEEATCRLGCVEGSKAPWVVVATCKQESVEVATCRLGCVEGSMAPWVVVATCRLGCVVGSMASWVMVVTCKLELAMVVICKLVQDDKVLVKGGMAPLVVVEMSIDNLLSFQKLS